LKAAMAFLARVTIGRWPVAAPSSVTAVSITFGLPTAAPHAHVHHDALQARHLEPVRVLEVLHQPRNRFRFVELQQRRGHPDRAVLGRRQLGDRFLGGLLFFGGLFLLDRFFSAMVLSAIPQLSCRSCPLALSAGPRSPRRSWRCGPSCRPGP
jgi:hypothetical protein